MSTTRRGTKLAALAIGLALVAAACGSDDDSTSTSSAATTGGTEAVADTTPEATTVDTEATEETTADTATEETTGDSTEGTEGDAPSGDAAMEVTVNLDPAAVWDDGSPITAADLECTWMANLNSTGSITTAGYDQVISVAEGESASQVIIDFSSVYAPYKNLFNPIIKKDAVEDCNNIADDFQTELPFSGREWKIDSWSADQLIMVPNENYWGDKKPTYDKLIMVPKADSDTEIASLKAGEVDFIYPQFYAGIEEALADPNVVTALAYGGDYENIYFQTKEDTPLGDPVFREALSESIDVDALFEQIYTPIAAGREKLTCGPIVPGDFCPEGAFSDTYDPDNATAILTDAGWEKDGSGFWAKDGEVPELRWMINSGNTRRENTQAYLIPLMAAAGFKVIPDNCEAECVFQQRLPSGDYDIAMYISTAPPDPSYLVPAFTCDNIPTEENDFKGQNNQYWCNQEASDALHESDTTADATERADLVKAGIQGMADDHIMLPLFQFPKSGAYRSDKVGNVEGQLNNYRAFSDTSQWEDLDGDGQVVIGAEQWPGCLNPITECANSSWYVWTISFPVLPGIWDTTNDSKYVTTDLVVDEPTVEVL